jgi:molybdopterin/thiamine biosynthesis adenylyltransferase
MSKFDDYCLCFVGLGSLGSEIAVQLARSGFKNFILLDHDNFTIENLSRHVLPSNFLHKNKAISMKSYLHTLVPNLLINAYEINVLIPGVTNQFIDIFREIRKKIILINTTNNLEVDHFINQISIENDYISIFASCSFDIQMGRVFRVIPGKTPCFNCIGIVVTDSKEFLKFPEIHEENQLSLYQGGIPGIGMDISIVASYTSKLALQTVIEDLKTDSKKKMTLNDHFILVIDNLEEYKIGYYPQQISKQSSCRICGNLIEESSNHENIEKLINELNNQG